MPKSIPNLFIVGAPKCGTTSMFDFLVQHKEVAYGIHKEPHFFNEDHPEYRHATNLEHYLSFFDQEQSCRYVLDASTNYFYSRAAISGILRFNDRSKIMVMLRNPIDLVVSLHSHFLFKQSETIEKLEQAWESGALRERAPEFVKKHPYPGHLSYQEAGQLGKYYLQILEVVPREQLLTVFFDDIVATPKEVIKSVCEFLELDFGPDPQFLKSNQKQNVYSRRLNKWMFYPPPWLKKLKSRLKHNLPECWVQRIDIRKLVSSKRPNPRRIDDAFRKRLANFFREDVDLLSQLTRRNLDAWLEG